ncbi:MAG: hypothetical protein HY781_08750 [Chloroflexi bacterium]|nr:hypothetical protein [Chloroflexota bacterium]
MIDHIWTVLCSRSVIDTETNNVSIQDVLEQITVNDDPKLNGFLPIPLELITLWGRRESDKGTEGMERVTFLTPSGKSNVVTEAKIDLSAVERHRHKVKFPGLPLSEAGRYYFRVEIQEKDNEWREVAAIPLTVMFQPQK